MGSSSRTIVWFRRDLRLEDNPALAAAAREGTILPVYIWCPTEEGQFYPGRVSRWWLRQSLIHLDQSLRSLGAPLVFIRAQSTMAALADCIDAIGATRVVFNHLYDPVTLVRDHNVKQKLKELNISVQSYNGDLLCEPWEVYDEKGHAFTVFDAYWTKCMSLEMEPVSPFPPWRLQAATGTVAQCSIEELGLESESEKSSNALLSRCWSPGWSHADKALTDFVDVHLYDYSNNRIKVGGNSTSLLSPHLHFGEISVRKVFQCVHRKHLQWIGEENSVGKESARLFLRAIGLREYSRYICFNFPFTHERSLLRNLRYFPWQDDQGTFKAWRQGRTGYPLVDAGMRELWATGWIHNRIRVIVSSFCVKYLLLPWRWGMKYFWDTLLDADLESDILGWQYISGGLPDGHELDRLDRPEVQGLKFDPEGEYVRHWLPELARMPTEWIHHPWDASPAVLRSAGVELGLNYPKPIVEMDMAGERLSEAIFTMWERESSARNASSSGMMEVVVDNLDAADSQAIPTVVLKERNPCPSTSSHDQKVPTGQNLKRGISNRKRALDDELAIPDNLHNYCRAGTSGAEEDLHSTAESSHKKQTTSSVSFSVPQYFSSSSKDQSLLDYSSNPDQAQTEQSMEQSSPENRQ